MLTLFVFANAAGTMMVSATAPIAQRQIGLSAATAAWCISISSLANMMGRICFGFLYDKIKGHIALCLALCINGVSMLMLMCAQSLLYFLFCLIAMGFSFGGVLACFAPLVRSTFGATHYNSNYGLIFIGYGLGAFAGPRICALRYASTGMYTQGFLFAAGFAFTAAALTWILYRITAKRRLEC